jgi:hypothetical protein
MEKEFKEYRDYIYLVDGNKAPKIQQTLYLKIFEDKAKKKYLGSLKIGLLNNYIGNDLREITKYIINLNYPVWETYEIEIVILK